jgi:hypothetical protein
MSWSQAWFLQFLFFVTFVSFVVKHPFQRSVDACCNQKTFTMRSLFLRGILPPDEVSESFLTQAGAWVAALAQRLLRAAANRAPFLLPRIQTVMKKPSGGCR